MGESKSNKNALNGNIKKGCQTEFVDILNRCVDMKYNKNKADLLKEVDVKSSTFYRVFNKKVKGVEKDVIYKVLVGLDLLKSIEPTKNNEIIDKKVKNLIIKNEELSAKVVDLEAENKKLMGVIIKLQGDLLEKQAEQI